MKKTEKELKDEIELLRSVIRGHGEIEASLRRSIETLTNTRDAALRAQDAAQGERRAAEAKVREKDDQRIKEERRANIAEAELDKALKALVIAVTRLGER